MGNLGQVLCFTNLALSSKKSAKSLPLKTGSAFASFAFLVLAGQRWFVRLRREKLRWH